LAEGIQRNVRAGSAGGTYLEPDFAALTPMRAFKVPQQLRGPHPAVTAFQEKRQHISRP
jgi:hypothetical protein